MAEPRGATPADWFHFDFVLGLGSHLLPCVPASPDVRVLKNSAIEGKVGKIPSQFNRDGEAHGLKEWQKREIMSAEVQQWSADPRLNICVRTGPISGVYAIDVDIPDVVTSEAVWLQIWSALGRGDVITTRVRDNSAKFLFPFRMESSCKKRKIKLDNKLAGPAIELLADGQQFVAAGSHSSGSRYQWSPELPSSLPTITLDQLNRIWETLTETYATPASKQVNLIALGKVTSTTQGTSDLLSPATGSPSESTNTESSLTTIADSDWAQLISALRFLLDKVADNDTWSAIGYALLSLQKSRPAEQLWYDFSRKAVGYQQGAPEAWWQSHKAQQPRSDYRHIFTLARERGFGRTSDASAFAPVAEAQPSSGSIPASEPDVAPPPLPEKPVVRLVSGEFSNILRQLEEIIEPHVYTQGPLLVRPSEAHSDKLIQRSTDAIMLCEATKSWGKKKFGDLATFERYAKTKTGGNWYTVDASGEHINALFELGSWQVLRPLDAIARAPFVRADGSICDAAGYDRRARVLYVPSAKYPGIPAVPDQDSAREALGRIRGVFHQFPWKEPASEAAFVSHILSEAARLAVDTCPMFFYTAPQAGTGKTILSRMASTIVHGAIPAIRAWVSDGDELRKVLFAALLAGDRSLLFDNVPAGFKTRAAELCGFITTADYNGRKLGESKSHDVPNRAVLSATGNNITPVGDMARRSIVIRLDANTERLRERRFEIIDIPHYVLANRATLLIDALTIIKAYRSLAVKPPMPPPFPSFIQWSSMVREPLIWLGMADPCDTRNETDDETESLGTVFTALAEHFGDREFTSNDVARIVGSLLDSSGELITALQQSGCSEPTSPLKVGYWMRGERDKISNGWKLTQTRTASHAARWKFIRVEESLT